MAKRRVTVRRATKKVDSRKKFPNPFNIFRGVNSAIKEISWSEKNLLIALFVLMLFVSLISDNGIRSVTGSFIEITGEQTVADAGITQAINDVLGIIFGFVAPILGLLGSKDLITIKLFLAVILYLILVYSPLDIGRVMRGKGKIIAGLIALFVAAILPEQIIQTYLLNLIPGFASLILALGLILFFLWALHKYEAESSPGHLLKALLYFLTFIYINGERANIISAFYLTSTPEVLNKVAEFALLAALIYSLFKIIIELYDAAGKRKRRIPEGAIEETMGKAGRAAGKAYGSFKAEKEEKKEKKKILEDTAGAEELAEKIVRRSDPSEIKNAYKDYWNKVRKDFSSVNLEAANEIFRRALKNRGISGKRII